MIKLLDPLILRHTIVHFLYDGALRPLLVVYNVLIIAKINRVCRFSEAFILLLGRAFVLTTDDGLDLGYMLRQNVRAIIVFEFFVASE